MIGLPPTPTEAEEFLHDNSDGAYQRLVDRLLASPHFGERWARHWLDLVRYAETLGHEFDYGIPNSWRYRDYVIRAFNADVPYEKFVIEHVAGDLLARLRRHPSEHFNESIMATAFYWFGQQTHSPVDVRQHQADVIENQIDVLTKTFLGLTVACARCHDHKFDAISTRDYYALYGVLGSSRYAQRSVIPADSIAPKIARLKTLKTELREALAANWSRQATSIGQYLLAAREANTGEQRPRSDVASGINLDAACLGRWVKALDECSTAAKGQPMEIWRKFTVSNASNALPWCADQWRTLLSISTTAAKAATSNVSGFTVFADFGSQDFQGWFLDGDAFGTVPRSSGDWIVGNKEQPVALLLSDPSAHSGVLSGRLQGVLRSPTFTITNRHLHLRLAGRDSRVNVFVNNFALIQSPIYGSLRHVLNHDSFRWVTIDLNMWIGHRAYLEFSDMTTPDLAGGGKTDGYGPRGFIGVSRILFSDGKSPPEEPMPPTALVLLGESPVDSIQTLAHRYQRAALHALRAWASGELASSSPGRAQIDFLNWLMQNRLLEGAGHSSSRVARLLSEFHEVESSIPVPARVPAMAEGTGLDEQVFIRGNPKNLGEVVPRRFLGAIAGSGETPFQHGSGRLELARRMTDPANPFLARVMVNRVWHHLFGRGLVPTPDDFGVLGQPPTHPELLDWLAAYYQGEARWSTKQLIRLLVTSSAYRMASQPSNPAAEEKDPDNRLFHRMPVRRLEGEAIRDALLALSGRMDRSMFGPSVPVHLNEFMDGRGRPKASGPLDGAGRRSIYLEVRRNFLSPMMRAFDAPVPFTTVGRRTVSNVPAQSLILMNDPLVLAQARAWSKRLLANPNQTPEERINEIFRAALGRSPSKDELLEALDFLKLQAGTHGFGPSDSWNKEELWTDLCHVMFNVKEFVFID